MAKVYITPPETFMFPDDKGPGDDFDLTAKVRIEPDGRTLCVETVDGVPLEEQDDTQEEAAEEPMPMPKKPATLADAVKMHRDGGYQM